MYSLNALSQYVASTSAPSSFARRYTPPPPAHQQHHRHSHSHSAGDGLAGPSPSRVATLANSTRDVGNHHAHRRRHSHHIGSGPPSSEEAAGSSPARGVHDGHRSTERRSHSSSYSNSRHPRHNSPGGDGRATPAAAPTTVLSLHARECVPPRPPSNTHSRNGSFRSRPEGPGTFANSRSSSTSHRGGVPPPSQAGAAQAAGHEAEGDKRRTKGFFRATLEALGIMGPILGAGNMTAVGTPSQRYHNSAIANRYVHDGTPPPLAHTERQNSDDVVMEWRERQRRREAGLGDGDSNGAGEEATGSGSRRDHGPRRHQDRQQRRRRVREDQVKVGGLSVDAQHGVLRRLQYQRPTAVDDLALDTPYTPYTPFTPTMPTIARSGANPFGPPPQPATPQSVTDSLSVAPHTQEEIDWVNSLQAAPTGSLPYPEASTHCQVCLRRFRSGEDVAELPCGHLFHFYCVVRWLKTRAQCPFCRQEVLERSRDGKDLARAAAATRTSSAPPPDV